MIWYWTKRFSLEWVVQERPGDYARTHRPQIMVDIPRDELAVLGDTIKEKIQLEGESGLTRSQMAWEGSIQRKDNGK